MDKVVALKTNSFWVLLHVLYFVNALMNLIAFEFGDALLVKSKETGLNVFFQLGKFLVSVSAIARLNFCSTWIVIFWQSSQVVAYQKHKTIEYVKFVAQKVVAVA